MNHHELISAIEDSISDASSIWGGDRASLLSKTDEWFSQYGVVSPYVLNNILIVLIGGNFGVKDVDVRVNSERQEMYFDFYLGFFSFYFKKNKTIYKLKKFLSKQFPGYDIYLNVHRFKYDIGEIKNEEKEKISRSKNQSSEEGAKVK